MPELRQIYQYNISYNLSSYESDIIHVAGAAAFAFTVFCSQNCTVSIRHMIDNNHQDIIQTESQNLLSNNSITIRSPLITRYVQFAVTSIASTPCKLITQAFYFFSGTSANPSGTQVFTNSNGTGAKLLTSNGDIKSLYSSDSNIDIIDETSKVNIILPDLLTPSSGSFTINGNSIITQNATIKGNSTVINSNNLNIQDNNILLNSNHTSNFGLNTGIVNNYLPSDNYSLIAGEAFINTVMVETNNNGSFIAGDLILITGAANEKNNGIFEVSIVFNPYISIKSSPLASFVSTSFQIDPTVQGRITKLTIGHLKSNTSGTLQYGTGNRTPIIYNNISYLPLKKKYKINFETNASILNIGTIKYLGIQVVVSPGNNTIDNNPAVYPPRMYRVPKNGHVIQLSFWQVISSVGDTLTGGNAEKCTLTVNHVNSTLIAQYNCNGTDLSIASATGSVTIIKGDLVDILFEAGNNVNASHYSGYFIIEED